mgnify:FL=1
MKRISTAYEILCDQLYEYSCPITKESYDLIVDIGQSIDHDESFWLHLRPFSLFNARIAVGCKHVLKLLITKGIVLNVDTFFLQVTFRGNVLTAVPKTI